MSVNVYIMKFTGRELSAILKMAQTVALADGNVSEEESFLMAMELLRFGVMGVEVNQLLEEAKKLTSVDACVVISQMTAEEKRYVVAYLGAMMCADGKIDDSEVRVWTVISSLCGLPEMNVEEAVRIIKSL